MESVFIQQLLNLCLQRIAISESTNVELEFIEVVKRHEATRRRWLLADQELKKHKETLVKSEVARTALEVKLKHARNQVDVEIKKRHKAEADYQYLERQMQLICDILVHDTKSSACLNDEQRSMLANFNHRGGNATQHKSRRLSVIDESSFLSHTDISYDRTDDDLDLDSTVVKPLKSRAREKRRSSMGPCVGPPVLKRGRVSGRPGDVLGERPVEKEIESTIVKASVTTPESGGQIHMVIDITQETPEKTVKTLRSGSLPSAAEQTSVWAPAEEMNPEIVTEMEVTATDPKLHQVFTPTIDRAAHHVFLSKTVIRPEVCVPCGKRIRFGKIAAKCRDCRLVAHPECKYMCSQTCSPSAAVPNPNALTDTLESFAPATQPRIPPLIVQCVNEIEKRGLEEKGIYRVPGGERAVKELREKYVLGKGPLALGKVEEIHVVCGLLKDFLRKLKEPLVTFRLHRAFMEASEILDDDNSAAAMYQAVGDLPQPNRDTLAFLMLHLQRVIQSPLCKMDLNNLARVFGPTVVGHGMPEPSPMTIMKDTNIQPKVVARMLSFPCEYWKNLLMVERDQVISSVVDANINNDGNSKDRDRLFKPLTSPELSHYPKTPASGSLKGKFKTLGTAFNNPAKCKTDPSKKRFFTSPS
ncbi:rac GTPase-activating protein 1 [Anguilla anguilla]|uniref:rac GTPase-activating protein 1 n=1 Tax=Anguilla anguilla TaxID=7936 RepID=UPI0015ADFEAE|nr:rac GTPase-activating protein 1 [Anguilla anguilla]XP_035248843.1 rac GTPase-activating protein 1 [Anguilla anguilla]XP_035248844.1 rac GTPase-activating protein 1 [Anguilla anguilla]XP_035248845.1 rac GTPase-activating protein 1 [Anguilla anguilla]